MTKVLEKVDSAATRGARKVVSSDIASIANSIGGQRHQGQDGSKTKITRSSTTGRWTIKQGEVTKQSKG